MADERRAIATLLDSLNSDQLATASLCAGWDVKTVAAHLVSDFADGFWGFIASGGSPTCSFMAPTYGFHWEYHTSRIRLMSPGYSISSPVQHSSVFSRSGGCAASRYTTRTPAEAGAMAQRSTVREWR